MSSFPNTAFIFPYLLDTLLEDLKKILHKFTKNYILYKKILLLLSYYFIDYFITNKRR